MATTTKEWQAWLEMVQIYAKNGVTTAMVTLIDLEGSSYKGLGARMLVAPDGNMTGTISGGCLENDVALHALATLKTGVPKIVTYDSRSDEDLLWGLGLGCEGLIRLLIEPLAPETGLALAQTVATALQENKKILLSNAWHTSNEGEIQVEGWASFTPECIYDAQVNSKLSPWLKQEAISAWQKHKRNAASLSPHVEIRNHPESGTSALFHLIAPAPLLFICGGGFDTPPLMELAKFLGWHCVLALPKPSPKGQTWPGNPKIVTGPPSFIQDYLKTDQICMAIIKSHHFETDRSYLKTLIQADVCEYIGLLGPKKRSLRMLEELQSDGLVVTEHDLAKLFFPVGLDIGAETPQEIAIAMVAEIRAVLADRKGGLLKNRQGPIHRR